MLDQAKQFPDKRQRPPYILWNGLNVTTADSITVPAMGIVRGEFLNSKTGIEQGFDLKIDGWIELQGGEKVSLLRTWNDPKYESFVEYPFHSRDGRLRLWNVYKMRYPGGQIVEEKWTGNAGFWVEATADLERVYHCSHGMADSPDFESLVFKISVKSEPN